MTRVGPRGAWTVLAALAILIAVDVPELGSDPWPFRGTVDPRGLFARLVRAAGRHWDLGFVRTPAVVAAVGIALAAAVALRARSWRAEVLAALAVVIAITLLVPAVVLQAGLRQSSQPWLYVNDSTYQIELAGELVRHGHTPYGRNYTGTGLERWYPAAGFPVGREQVALRHLAYFPGTPLSAAAWNLLPHPLDDYRFFVLLCTIGLFFAALVFHAPIALRIVLGAALAANPLAVRAAWFGTADAPSLLCVVLAFALLSRRRLVEATALLALAVVLKQFALVALPFFVVAALAVRPPRSVIARGAGAFAAIVLAAFLPFLIADAGAVWRDTIAYGGSTYRIVGYGLSSLFLKAGLVDNRYGSYPFVWLLIFVWLPVTAWLAWNQYRDRRTWVGAASFAVSMFVLLFISRVLQTSYLVWPLDAVAVAALLTNAYDERPRPPANVAGEVNSGELQPITTRP
jgi:Glycosyltransferase family 87